jgi:hypothetical protein
MKHLEKFYNYLNESNSLELDEIKDCFANLSDIIKVNYEQLTNITFRGNITNGYKFRIEQYRVLKKEDVGKKVVKNGEEKELFEANLIFGDEIWEIYEELLNIRSRLKDKYHIGFTQTEMVMIMYLIKK